MSVIRNSSAGFQHQLTTRSLFFSTNSDAPLTKVSFVEVCQIVLDKAMRKNRPTLVTIVPALSFLLTCVLTIQAQEIKKSSMVSGGNTGYNEATGVKVAPPGEMFSVWMPGAPKTGAEALMFDREPALLKYYGLSKDGAEYAVFSLSGLESDKVDLAHMLMLDLYRRFIPTSLLDDPERNGAAVKATYERDILLNGYSGREYNLQAGNRTGRWYLYSMGSRFYAIAATTAATDKTLVNRFLGSFLLGTKAQTAVAPAVKEATPPKPPVDKAPSPTTGTWLVILQTLSKAERGKADQRTSVLRSLGYEARVVDTNQYPKLRNGFLAVVLGPYSKNEAQNALKKVRSVAPDSYLKSGW